MQAVRNNKTLFYFLSFTWGLPMTLVGLATALLLRLTGRRSVRYQRCWHFELGEHWGGVSLGPVFVTNVGASAWLKAHESGHSLQNCLYGPLMPVLVALPSVLRFWWIRLRSLCGSPPAREYDAIWFERQATEWGMVWNNKNTKQEPGSK